MAPIVLGYWDIRGFAQYPRLLMAAAGVEWEDKLYTSPPPPAFDRSQWLNDKPNLGLDFPNLPYLIDGDVRMSQSIAILRYLARKYGFEGKTEQEKIRIDMVEQQICDYRMAGGQTFYNPNFANMIDDYKNGLPEKMAALSKFLGNHEYFSGGGLSYVDFLVYEVVDLNRTLSPGLLDNYKNLADFMARIEAHPKIKEYMNSPKFIKWPFNGAPAKWGGPYSDKL